MKSKKIKSNLLVFVFTLFGVSCTQYILAQNPAVLVDEFILENPPFVECHASTIELTDQGLIASWFGGSKEGNKDVEIWTSFRENGRWSYPMSVADGIQHEAKRYPCWNPVLYRVPNENQLLLFYKVGPNPSNWWGMLKKSYDNGRTWTAGVRLPEDILGPIKNKPFMTSDGKLICPSSTELNPNKGWKIHFEITPDLGKNWYISPEISDDNALNAIQPSILSHADGRVLQAIARSKDGGVVNSWSYDGGRSWNPIASIGLPNPNSGTDAITLKNGLHVLVYNHSEKPEGKWSGYRSPLNVAISTDGKDWKNVLELIADKGEYSYPAVIEGKDGLIHITYTWKRRNIKHVIVDTKVLLKQYPEKKDELLKVQLKNNWKSILPVIFDTDIGNDIDDVLALAMLYNYQKEKKINLLGVTINKANPYTVPFIDILNRFYGFDNIPIGFIGTNGPTTDVGKYLSTVVDDKAKNKRFTFKRKLNIHSKVPEAWKLQRKLLASQEDNSVVIISVGFSSNLYRLLQSEADEYSSLTGYELVQNKVKLLSVMAGNFIDTTKAEYNVKIDIPSAKYVFENWPTEVLFGGWEVGSKVKYPATSILSDFKTPHPLVLGYENYLPMPYDRETWDLISVLVAVEGCGKYFKKSNWGHVSVTDKGNTIFNPSINGKHQYLKVIKGLGNELQEKLIQSVTGEK